MKYGFRCDQGKAIMLTLKSKGLQKTSEYILFICIAVVFSYPLENFWQTESNSNPGRTIRAVGKLYANKEVSVVSQVSGIVISNKLNVGDTVKKEQILLQIDPTDYRLIYDEVKAKLSAAEAQFIYIQNKLFRAQELKGKDIISQEEFEGTESSFKHESAKLNNLEIALKIAKRNLIKTTIRAPFSGLVSQKYFEKGQFIVSGHECMLISDLSNVRLIIKLTETDHVHITKGLIAQVRFDAFPSNLYSGIVDIIGIIADPRTETYPIEITIRNPDLVLKPGFTARAEMITN